LKLYTTADGLARNQILRIVPDSRGFLWFCTFEGLSLFNGYTFNNYTTADGLPHRGVRDVLETRAGTYWVATGAGIARLNLRGTRSQLGSKATNSVPVVCGLSPRSD
jgi:ligand-binding sensor domain-containing protein